MPTLLTSVNISAIQFKESASPGTPASGFGRMYVFTDSTFHFVNDAGTDLSLNAIYAGGIAIASQAANDIIYASSATQLARLANGTTGQVLTATTSAAPSWAAPAAAAAGSLTGTILNATVVTSSLTAVGTITTGVWNAGAVTSSGVLTVNGFGTHTFSAGSNGGNKIALTNTTSGTAAFVQIPLTAGTNTGYVTVYSQGYSTSGVDIADSMGVFGSAAGGLSVGAIHASGAIRLYSGGTTLRMQINTNGTQTWAPYGAGTATFDASGNITSVSDARFKDRVNDLPYGLAEVLRLRPVQHGYNELSGLEREHLYGGFLAQEVQPVMPLAVGQDQRGYYTLSDRPILGAVVNAIQELNDRLTALEAQGR